MASPNDERLARLEGRVTELSEQLRGLRGSTDPGASETASPGDPSEAKKSSEARPKPKDGWDRLQALSSVIFGIAGIAITVLLTHALEVRQLEIAQGQAVKELLGTLNRRDVSDSEARAAGFALAAYGRAAIAPLVHQLQSSDPIRRGAAEEGLLALGLTHRGEACDILARIIDNRTRRYSWTTHHSAIRLLGSLGCRGKRGSLLRYRDVVGRSPGTSGPATDTEAGAPDPLAAVLDRSKDCPRDDRVLQNYRQVVKDGPEPLWSDVCAVRREIRASLRLIARR